MTTLPLDAPLSHDWVFVGQCRAGTLLTPDALHGWVKHIMSCQATLLTSLEELRVFMANAASEGYTWCAWGLGKRGGDHDEYHEWQRVFRGQDLLVRDAPDVVSCIFAEQRCRRSILDGEA